VRSTTEASDRVTLINNWNRHHSVVLVAIHSPFRCTFYRFLTVAAPLAESTTYGAVTVRERQKVPGIRVHLNAAKKQLDFFTTP